MDNNKTLLYKLNKGDIVYLNDKQLIFCYIDGTYSVCRVVDTGDVVHLSATTPLIKHQDGWIIDNDAVKAKWEQCYKFLIN